MKRLALAGVVLCALVLLGRAFAHPAFNNFVSVFPDIDGGGLTGDHSGLFITNAPATGSITFNLPPAVAGMHYTFAVMAAQTIVINPDNNDLFIATGISSAPGAGDAIESVNVVGTLIEIVAVDSTNWMTIRKNGTWNLD